MNFHLLLFAMLKNYLLLAMKVLLRRKFFTFISLVGISLTLATLLVVTAFIDFNIHPPQPYSKQDRMLFVGTVIGIGQDYTVINEASYGFHDKYVRNLPGIEAITIQTSTNYTVYPNGQKYQLAATKVDGAFWDIYDMEFLEGAGFSEDDNKQERTVAVISATTRQRYFGDGQALNKSITLGDKSYTIVGVVKDIAVSLDATGDVWIPLSIGLTSKGRAAILDEGTGGYFCTILAKSAEDIPLIQSEFQSMIPTVKFGNPHIQRMIAGADTKFERSAQQLFGMSSDDEEYGSQNKIQKILTIMILAALGFMALPAINLVNINVSRIMERASEIGVRKAFGASSSTLVGQFVTENLILTLVGMVLGIALAQGILMWITASGFIAGLVLHMNLRVAFYALCMAVVFGLLSGVYPAWKMSRLPIVQSLKGSINV